MDDLYHDMLDEAAPLEPGETRTFTVSLTEKEVESAEWLYCLTLYGESHDYVGKVYEVFGDTTQAFEIIEDKESGSIELKPVQ